MTENANTTLRVVHGEPSLEELAVLTAVLAAVGDAPAATEPARSPGGWSDPGYQLRRPLRTGPGAWAASLR
ncbi:MAG: acyl-CoA carboxylase subunit epsilon [Jatrophihabitans sp.]